MYQAIAALLGALITFMYGVNSRFSAHAGNLVSTLIIHVVGLAVVSVLCLLKREESRPGRLPAYYYLGGLIGVGTVFAGNYAFAILPASLAVALGLLGQTLLSVVMDAVGFLGRRRYALTARRLPGIGLAVVGVAVLAGRWPSDALALLVALASGALPLLSVSLNSELGLRRGVLRSTRVNYLVGLAATLVLVLVVRPQLRPALGGVVKAGPLLALGGGVMGVAVVTGLSIVFPRMPAFSATLLVFSGQACAGVLIDLLAEGAFDARKVVGTLLVLSGLALNGLLAKRGDRPSPPKAAPPTPGGSFRSAAAPPG